MNIVINVRSDIMRFARSLTALQRDQLPFATALALTRVAQDVERDVRERLLPSRFDRPTPFVQSAFRVIPATKARPTAEVALKDLQRGRGIGDLLARQEDGGARRAEASHALVMPAAARLDSYGNLPRGTVRALKGRSDVFIGRIRGVGGVWQRPGQGRRLRLLVGFRAAAQYRPRLGWAARVRTDVERGLAREMPAAMARAMASAVQR